MTTPTDDYVHQALVSDGAPPRPWCGGVGRSVMRKAEVTCPDCLQLDADRKARTEVHDTPPEIKPGDEFIDDELDKWTAIRQGEDMALRFGEGPDEIILSPGEAERAYGPMTKVEHPSGAAAALARLGDAYAEPAKTHDLSVRREHGNVIVTAEAATGNCQVYLQDGVALDLGRVLAALTLIQREVLIDDLMGGGQ